MGTCNNATYTTLLQSTPSVTTANKISTTTSQLIQTTQLVTTISAASTDNSIALTSVIVVALVLIAGIINTVIAFLLIAYFRHRSAMIGQQRHRPFPPVHSTVNEPRYVRNDEQMSVVNSMTNDAYTTDHIPTARNEAYISTGMLN